MEDLVNLRLCETKVQFQSKSLWELIIFHCLYYYSGFIQTPAVENHCQNTPWPSKNPRENKESIWLTKKITAGCVPLCVEKCVRGSSLVMVSKMCFKGLSIFYFTVIVSGSRSSLVNMEARPLTSDMLTRRCVVTRLSDLTIERFKEAVQTLGAGAILILLPKNPSIAALEKKEVNLLTIMYTKMLCKISVFWGLPIIFSWILEGKTKPVKYVLTLRATDCHFVIIIYNVNKGCYMAVQGYIWNIFQHHETRW